MTFIYCDCIERDCNPVSRTRWEGTLPFNPLLGGAGTAGVSKYDSIKLAKCLVI